MMTIPEIYQIALKKMLRGDKVKLNQKGREMWLPNGKAKRGDIWNTIQSIDVDCTVTLVSDTYVIRKGVAFRHVHGLDWK